MADLRERGLGADFGGDFDFGVIGSSCGVTGFGVMGVRGRE